MPTNMGTADRRIRGFIVAPLLVVAAWLIGFGTTLGIIALVLAAVMAITAVVGFCPLYAPFGITTCPRTRT